MTTKKVQALEPLSDRILVNSDRFLNRHDPRVSRLSGTVTQVSALGDGSYRVVGPVCRLFDREELEYPFCSLQWRGKAPSWNRIGKRYVADLATKRAPSYSVVLVGGTESYASVITLYYKPLTDAEKEWWFTPPPKLRHYQEELAA
ncbi:MAG: hypothetical protein RBJ76_13625 [Stenomitos frigidus ULC029]